MRAQDDTHISYCIYHREGARIETNERTMERRGVRFLPFRLALTRAIPIDLCPSSVCGTVHSALRTGWRHNRRLYCTVLVVRYESDHTKIAASAAPIPCTAQYLYQYCRFSLCILPLRTSQQGSTRQWYRYTFIFYSYPE